MYRAALSILFLSGGLVAQDFLYLTGFSDSGGPSGSGNSFPCSRFRDLNGDGFIDDTSELFTFLHTSYNTRNGTGSFMTDLDWVREGSNFALYFSDSGDGRITRAVDKNNNGQIDAPTGNPATDEVTEFFDLMTGFAPEGIAVRRDTANNRTIVYVANDDQSSGPGIHRLVDLNGDGDAFDAGESSIIVDASAGLSVPGTGGPVPIVNDRWFSVEVLPSGKIVAYNAGPTRTSGGGSGAQGPDMFCWYEFTDNNGAATNFQVFFNPSQINGIATHPDFASGGTFPQWDVELDEVNFPNLHDKWSNIPFLTRQRRLSAGPSTYYFGSTYEDNLQGGFSGNNPGGQVVSGLFYRWLDANQNDTIDANEITLFGNITNTTVAGVAPFSYTVSGTPIVSLTDNVFGLQANDGKLHLCWDLSGPGAKGVVTMDDMNNNGVIETGEASQAYVFDPNVTNSVYHPTFGPFIKAFSSLDRGFMPGPFVGGYTPYGQGCAEPANGLAPVSDALGGAPSVGNQSFELAVLRAFPGFPCQLLLGVGRTGIPPNLGIFGRPECPVLVGLLDSFGPFISDSAGVAGLAIPIPNVPSLAGAIVNFQWIILNTQVGALTTSNGLEIQIQP